MENSPIPKAPSAFQRFIRGQRSLAALWPQGPIALALVLIGALNILNGMSLPFTILQEVRALNGIAESVSVLGGTVQIILGLMLVVAGVGLLWRLVSAWMLSVLLLAIIMGVSIAQGRWGYSLIFQAILFAALLLAKSHFVKRTALASLVFSMSSIVSIMAYGIFGSYLLGTGFRPVIHDLNTATYFTIMTLSTVGYGDIVPVTVEARWFAVSLVFVGLSVFVGSIASVIGPKISGEFNRIFNTKDKPMELKDHVILVGEGSIARNTAKELSQRGVRFVRIMVNRASAAATDHDVIEGDATTDAVLQKAGIEHARMVIAAREDDGENAFISLGAKDLNPNVRVLAVASSALSMRRLKLARADLVFSPVAVGSRLLADLVEGNQILPEFKDLLEGHPKKI